MGMRRHILQFGAAMLFVCITLLSGISWAQEVNVFVNISEIRGESTDDMHKGWIDAMGVTCSAFQTGSATASSGGGASSQRPDFEDLKIWKGLDMASPKLFVASAEGTYLGEVLIEFVRSGGERGIRFFVIKLTNVIVSAVDIEFHKELKSVVESVSFNYGKIEWTYTQYSAKDGQAMGNVAGGWDLEGNVKIREM